MPVDNDFLARADAEAKLRVIKKARKDMNEGVMNMFGRGIFDDFYYISRS